VIYSLIETTKETRLDPFRYLTWVLETSPMLDRMGYTAASDKCA
jgi:hypothetical protein